jgi:hypothetical protein
MWQAAGESKLARHIWPCDMPTDTILRKEERRMFKELQERVQRARHMTITETSLTSVLLLTS